MKKLVASLLVAMMALSLVACGGKQPTETQAPAADTTAAAETQAPETTAPAEEKKPTYVWKFSSVANQQEAQGLAQAAFEEKLEELTNGDVDVQNYYAGTLYSQDACTEAVVTGDLEINSSSPAYVSEYYKAASMFTAAYMFKNYDHLQAFLASDLFTQYRAKIAENTEFELISVWYQGSRGLDLNFDTPEVKTPADLDGMVIRMPNTEAWLNLGNSLGFKATGLAFTEVYTSQQTGVINGNDNPIGICDANGFLEVTKQYVRTNHLVDEIYIIMNKTLFQSLDADLQEKVLEAGRYAADVMAKNIIDNESALYEKCESLGIKVVDPDLDAFVANSFKYYQDNNLTADWDMDLYNAIQELG